MQQEIIQKYKNHIVDEKTQKNLNKPLTDQTGFNDGHEEFLKLLIQKLENKELNPHDTETLYNKDIYDKLTENEQEKASLTAINLMSMIRQIESLWKLDKKATFQIQNIVETIFQMKSHFEEKHGNVYVI